MTPQVAIVIPVPSHMKCPPGTPNSTFVDYLLGGLGNKADQCIPVTMNSCLFDNTAILKWLFVDATNWRRCCD